jgi:hypothetical protein
MTFHKFIRNNGLMLTMFGIFLLAIVGMSIAGWHTNNETLQQHSQPIQNYGEYVSSGDFIEGVFENWESEFLQMWALIMLTIFLRQKGSEDSKPMRGKAQQDTSSRLSIINASDWKKRGKAIRHAIYAHSLGLAMLGLFIISFSIHAFGGVSAHNEEALQHGSETMNVLQYVGSSQFWYESLQNWQSEFLAIGALLVLSIKLRERGSPESKPVGTKYDHKTGE